MTGQAETNSDLRKTNDRTTKRKRAVQQMHARAKQRDRRRLLGLLVWGGRR